jgi:hypothetical protein
MDILHEGLYMVLCVCVFVSLAFTEYLPPHGKHHHGTTSYYKLEPM